MVTRPFLQASAAIERVLQMRDAHSHLSILATSDIRTYFSPFSFTQFVKLVHGNIDTREDKTLDDLHATVDGGLESL